MSKSNKIIKLLATFFYMGEFPVAPGSLASLAALFLCVGLYPFPQGYVLFAVVITAVGFFVSGRMEKIAGTKDPSCVVIDEVAGVMIAFWALPLNGAVLTTAYFLFRAFDMFKVYPISRLEALPGGKGIMLDDLLAGVYTNVVMHLAIRWAGVI